jgi:nucleotide-binding universal stress UspA family protein
MYRHILIPTDGSALSRKAIAAGIAFARSEGARITGLFAAPAPTPVIYKDFLPVGLTTPEAHARMIEKAAARYLGFIEAAAKKAGVPCETLCVTDDFPADAILGQAAKRKCDLVFMASHGRGGLSKVLLGSQTHKVVTRARIPVLVWR